MTRLRGLRSQVWFVLRRLRASWAISLAVIVSLSALIGVWVGLPLYAESASARLLAVEVEDAASDGVPFGYLFSYNRLSGGNQPFSSFEPLNEFLDGPGTPFDTTVRERQRFFASIPFDLTVVSAGETEMLDNTSFVSLSAFDTSAGLVQGRLAEPADSLDGPIEVVVDEQYATDLGLTPGQELSIVNRRVDLDDPNRTFPILVTGIWAPPETETDLVADPATRFLRNGSLTRNLVVPEATLTNVIDPLTATSLSNGQWLVLLDSSSITTDSVATLLATTERINRQVDDRLRGTRLLVSPESSLEGFQEDVARLNRGLTLFSLPTIALVISVAALLLGTRWARRRGEVLMLRRRGVPAGQIISQTAIEALLLGLASAVAGLFVARVVATFMARTETFLRLGDGVNLDLVMNSRSWRALMVATVLAVFLIVLPSLATLRDDIATERRRDDAARPWWQRSRADLALVAAIAFFTWFLLGRDVLQDDLLEDPIVILLPAATAFAVGLVILRVVPWFAGRLARLLERTDRTAPLLVARRAERVPQAMTAPLLLLVITGALAVYTGSLARTLDLQLFDTAHHLTGAASSMRPSTDDQLGLRFEIIDGETELVNQSGPTIDTAALDKIWGIESASRLASLAGRIEPPSGPSVPVNFTGIDTKTFADIAFWRDDYASRPLPHLIAQLDATPDGVLVPRSVMQQGNLELGDIVGLSVRVEGLVVTADMVVVGTFDQFPTWVPGQDLPPAVASLNSFEARSPATVARQLLFEPSDGLADPAQTRADFSRLGSTTATPRSASEIIERVQLRPERQGVFGLLTVSFGLSTILTVAAFIFYAAFGFTRQLTELGVLRALGLPARSLTAMIALDLFLVALVGVGTGAATGLAMARWYLPELIDNPLGSAPTMLAEIDWTAAIGIPLALAAVLTLVTITLLVALRRIRLFEAIKVGGGQ